MSQLNFTGQLTIYINVPFKSIITYTYHRFECICQTYYRSAESTVKKVQKEILFYKILHNEDKITVQVINMRKIQPNEN